MSRAYLERLARAGASLIPDEEFGASVAKALRVDNHIIALITDYQTLAETDRHSVRELARVLAGRPKPKAP